MTLEMKFGWVAPVRAMDDTDGSSLGEQIITVLEQIRGKFDSVWMSDHVHPPIFRGKNNGIGVLECLSTISYLAGLFPDFDFGTMVLSQPLRNPAMVAKIGASLQTLTKGRFILGLGSGSNAGNEYVAYGYGDEFPKAAVRVAQTAEAVQIIRQMWITSPATFEGKHYQIREAYCEPKPKPLPPIMIAGAGEELALRMVAQFADWSNFGGDPDGFAHKLAVLRKHCEAVGRNYDEIVKTYLVLVAVANTEAEAEHVAQTSSKPFGPRLITGTPEQVAAQLQPYVELGVGYFITYFVDFPDPAGAILFAEEVMPQLRQRS
jgi:alkanesulfonate monooxygenase SsuD/methylene tetrahydromethanopterin reductase-like flavin-dependent oxidoreductase (luciferase family)